MAIATSGLFSVAGLAKPKRRPKAEAPSASKACKTLVSPELRTTLQGIEKISVDTEQAFGITQTTTFDSPTSDGCAKHCRTDHYGGTEAFDSLAAFNPNDATLWPGSVVQGKTLPEGILTAIPLTRAQGTVTISGFASAADASFSQTIDLPNHANVADAISRILTNHPDAVGAASISFTQKTVHSLEDAAFQLGFSGKYMGAEIRNSLGFSTKSDKHYYAAQLVQRYYSVSINSPSSPEGIFCDGLEVGLLTSSYMGPSNPPAYVATVDFGRMMILTVESDADESTFNDALYAAYKSGAVGVEVNLSDAQKHVLETSTAHVLIIGGAASDGAGLTASNPIEALSRFLSAGAQFSLKSPGSPISYTVKYLRDDTLARVSFATDYTIDTCDGPEDCPQVSVDAPASHQNGGRFPEFAVTNNYRQHACGQPVGMTFAASNVGGDWCDFVMTGDGGRRIGHTDHFGNGNSGFSGTLNPGEWVHIELWTPGFLGAPGSGGGDAGFQTPNCGNLTVRATCQ
jgi:hypothetical protein